MIDQQNDNAKDKEVMKRLSTVDGFQGVLH